MNKMIKPVVYAMVAIMMMVSMFGCYGNMALTKKVWQWNGSFGDKLTVNVVFWVLNFLPVYQATLFIDVFVLNTIEFWTGSNPLAMVDGQQDIRIVQTEDKTYEVITTKNKISISEIEGPDAGKTIDLQYDTATSSWFLNDGQNSHKIATVDGNTLNLIYPDGQNLAIDLSSN